MLETMQLKQDANYTLKTDILKSLQQNGIIDHIRAQIRSQVIKSLEDQKKKQFGGASKYLQRSELSNPVTKQVVSNDDGLLCAEVIREFLEFYHMNYSMQVFVPEMSLESAFPKGRPEVEREIGIADKDQSKPILLKLVEAVKYGGISAPDTVKKASMENVEKMSSNFEANPLTNQALVEQKNEEEKQEQKKSGKKKSDSKKKKTKPEKQQDKQSVQSTQDGKSMSLLGDLPSLGAPKQQAKNPLDFDFDDLEDSGRPGTKNDDSDSKLKQYEKQLSNFDKEEKEGFKLKGPGRYQQNAGGWEGFDNDIEEEIPSDEDRNDHGLHILESGGGGQFVVTNSQSLGIDRSVDSLQLDDYDHVELVEVGRY